MLIQTSSPEGDHIGWRSLEPLIDINLIRQIQIPESGVNIIVEDPEKLLARAKQLSENTSHWITTTAGNEPQDAKVLLQTKSLTTIQDILEKGYTSVSGYVICLSPVREGSYQWTDRSGMTHEEYLHKSELNDSRGDFLVQLCQANENGEFHLIGIPDYVHPETATHSFIENLLILPDKTSLE